MEKSKLSYSEAKAIPIKDFLSGLGFEPAKIRGEDYWYHSPLREERTPSFKVNIRLNRWYDHGIGEGGTILELGAKLHQCTVYEALVKLSEGHPDRSSLQQQKRPIEKIENKLEVVEVNTLTSPNLVQYLKNRGIDIDIARTFCKEVDFRIGVKFYSAIGFPNQSGAYELRNSWFKGSSSPKDISLIQNNHDKISVLEGFMDFLSLHQLSYPEINRLTKESDFLILNSIRLLNRSLPLLHGKKEINLFLDNDLAANQAKDNLKATGILYQDASIYYSNHKDVNEYLVSSQTKLQETLQRKSGKRFRHRF
jgi:hypothetical protein